MEWLNGIINIDKELFLFLNGFYNDFRDTFYFFVTRKESWLPLYLIVVFYLFKTYRNKGFIILIFLLIGVVLSDQLSGIIKEIVQRWRPVYEPDIQHMVHNYFRKGGFYGFFSSHASNTFFMVAFTSWFFKNRIYKYSLILWALLVCYSRIYLGQHYPLDIIAGMIFGIFLGWLFYRIVMFIEDHFFVTRPPNFRKTNLSNGGAAVVFLIFIVITGTMLILTRHLYHYQYL
ncbi:MAG: phosphatase PAP2 family protein [Prolixibacteraceae bacterium]|nr:phosphatase PAP2 family protein [Prolixibacteraceae bacterium]MBN2774467.1 phosphatase PAP2 family protein [Prolixibacteraceae bacterium]